MISILSNAIGFLHPKKKRDGGMPSFNFTNAAVAYSERLRTKWMDVAFPRAEGPPLGILVAPWISTPTPFFAIELGLLCRLSGHPVTLILDTANVLGSASKPREVAAIRETISCLPAAVSFLDAEDAGLGTRPASSSYTFIPELLQENSVRYAKGESGASAFLSSQPHWEMEAVREAMRIERLLSGNTFGGMLIPGGVWGLSGIYLHLARRLAIPFTTYDSGAGQLFLSKQSAAAHFGDIPTSLALLLNEASTSVLREAVGMAREALEKRIRGEDMFNLQRAPKTGKKEDLDILVVLNRRCDTAALCRHRLFRSVSEWLGALLNWVTSKRDISIMIRQHPCERLPEYRGQEDWNELFAPFTSLGKRFRFIRAEEDVNTYDLIESAKVVLPFTSRVGIEAAMLGKPVILAADCYYENCGFTINPVDPAAYFTAIEKALAGVCATTEDQTKKAELVYYLMECCTFVETRLTPQPADFSDWLSVPPHELSKRSEIQTIICCATGKNTLATLTHRKRIETFTPKM